MEVKLTLLVLIAVILMTYNPVVADFFFNHPLPKLESIQAGESHMKCVPGRTIIKITEHPPQILTNEETDSDEYRLRIGTRRKHMTVPTQDESCKICVCSADGKTEYCSRRPAENANECLMLKDITETYNSGQPFEHTRSLAYRIRRDYLWHNDEIPYNARAKCFRGHSYYSNSLSAHNTDVDIATDIDSLLDYKNDFVCFYCVCSVDGNSVGCIHRDVAFCNFFRDVRDDKRVRDRYTSLFEQDRPTYFRQLSWRMRRTMDSSIFELLDTVGNAIKSSTNDKKKCVPFISEYSNCNDDNLCSGCTRCHCTAEAEWSCQDVNECGDQSVDNVLVEPEDDIFDNALKMLEIEMKKKKADITKNAKKSTVPTPQLLQEQNHLLASEKDMDDILSAFMRPKRSIDKNASKHNKRSVEKISHKNTESENTGNNNNTIKFYETVDDINEDTFKDINVTGTLIAKKLDNLPATSISRRSGITDNSSRALQIEYNQPKAFNQINDNKIEILEQENKFDASHENLKSVLGNYTQKVKDKDLSKIVVNELKKGSEVIGDANAPVTSNITFTPENDTLTAMAFIAGNLLNKLWNMEKDATHSSMETDVIKHEKINELLDLFKEPLNLRQETFLKNALEQLSFTLDKGKEGQNISICQNIEEAKKLLYDTNNTNEEEKPNSKTKASCKDNQDKEEEENKIQKSATIKAIAKINNVLELIKKFENIQVNLSELKHGPKIDLNLNRTSSSNLKNEIDTKLTKYEKNSLNTFGTLLDKITKLILPKRNNKKIANQIKSQSIYTDSENLKIKFKKMYNIDLANMTVTAKDKLILDYLTHVDRNPDCLLNSKKYKTREEIPRMEGNILLNLSEFFKMKSFSDLIKLLEPEQETQKTLQIPTSANYKFVETTTTSTTISENKKISPSFKGEESTKFNSTKEKLKAHLKTIIEDLVELQSSNGVSINGNIKIADALPCIYNILNAGKEVENVDPISKVANIFNGLKKEIKASQSRRSQDVVAAGRPKSAVVWERVVNNLNKEADFVKSRRSFDTKTPKSYEKIKQMIDKIENSSSSYKHYALLTQIPPSGRLMFLKALEQDVQSTINVIEEIKLAFDNLTKLPEEQFRELAEFVENMGLGINLSVKVNEKIKPEIRKYFVNEINSSSKMSKPRTKKKPVQRYNEPRSEETDEMRVSRIQILSQLMRNRMELFLKTKEQTEYDVHNDMNYNIARRILYYLDAGNYNLAMELYRVFFMRKQNYSQNHSDNDKFIVTSTPKLIETPVRRLASPQMEPLVQFEDPVGLKAKHLNWANQDNLIKQLINIKNMGM